MRVGEHPAYSANRGSTAILTRHTYIGNSEFRRLISNPKLKRAQQMEVYGGAKQKHIVSCVMARFTCAFVRFKYGWMQQQYQIKAK